MWNPFLSQIFFSTTSKALSCVLLVVGRRETTPSCKFLMSVAGTGSVSQHLPTARLVIRYLSSQIYHCHISRSFSMHASPLQLICQQIFLEPFLRARSVLCACWCPVPGTFCNLEPLNCGAPLASTLLPRSRVLQGPSPRKHTDS